MSSEKKGKLISFLKRDKSASKHDKSSDEPLKAIQEGDSEPVTSTTPTKKSKSKMANQDQAKAAAGQARSGGIIGKTINLFRPRIPQINLCGCVPKINSLSDLIIQIAIASFIGAIGWLIWTGNVRPSGGVTADDLWDFKSQLRYGLRWQILPLSWVLWTVWQVWSIRRTGDGSKDTAHRLAGAEDRQRTALLEAFLSSQTQLILITYLEARCILTAVPIINILFIAAQIGRWSAIRHIQWHAAWAVAAPIVIGVAVSNIHLLQYLGIQIPIIHH